LGCNNYRCCVDVWSVGCIVAEMANKLAFLQGDSEIDQLHKIFRVLGTPTNNDWPGVQELPYWRNRSVYLHVCMSACPLCPCLIYYISDMYFASQTTLVYSPSSDPTPLFPPL